MKHNKLSVITSFCILAALASGCEKESQVNDATYMSVFVSDISSKATVTTTQSFEGLYATDGFMVFSCGHDAPSSIAVNIKPFVKNDALWTPDTKIAWPAYASDFMAWVPYDKATFSKIDHTISYTVPTDVTQQQDLLVTEKLNIPAHNNAPIELSFDHALTAVRLVVGQEFPGGSSITSISLCNVLLTGKYQFAPADDAPRWTDLSGSGTISLDLSASPISVPEEYEAGMPITGSDQTFFVIPQTCADDAHLEIMYGGKTRYIYLPEGFVFRQGDCVTLQVNGKNDWFYVTVGIVEHREDVEAGTMSI